MALRDTKYGNVEDYSLGNMSGEMARFASLSGQFFLDEESLRLLKEAHDNSHNERRLDAADIQSILSSGRPMTSGRRVPINIPEFIDTVKRNEKNWHDFLTTVILVNQINQNLADLYAEQERLLKAYAEELERNEQLRTELEIIEQELAEIREGLPKDSNGNISWSTIAEDTFGEEHTSRLPGESEAEYQDRMKQLLEEEMLDSSGRVKPEYSNTNAGRYLAKEQEQTAKREQIESSDARLDRLRLEIAENARKIEAELHRKRQLLDQQLDQNENFLRQLQQIKGKSGHDGDHALTLILQDRPDLQVSFDSDDTFEEKVEQLEEAIADQNIEIQVKQVELEDEIAENDKVLDEYKLEIDLFAGQHDKEAESNSNDVKEKQDVDLSSLSSGFNASSQPDEKPNTEETDLGFALEIEEDQLEVLPEDPFGFNI